MPSIRSVNEIDLAPAPGKTYWSVDREWREEFIYFLMVDRFHDGKDRSPSAPRPVKDPERLKRLCGGTLKGITRNLDYIQGLGCTALWLSPVFENDPSPESYHGYAIRNYLDVDPRFGTKADLVELVDAAHKRGMRVFLDAVANHCGDVFSYAGGDPKFFSDDGRRYDVGEWRHPDYPVPAELRNPAYFHRRGQIREWGWDRYPETQWGDFYTLKGFNNEDTPEGIELQEIIIKAHQYWIREADIDGFRMDAVKHMGEAAIARFCQKTREYAYSLGKRNFFLFGELVGGDEAINRYTGPNTSGRLGDKTVFFGLHSVLDFPLYFVLPGVIKGLLPPPALFNRYEALRERALSRGELGRYLVSFIDNHDQIGQMYKRRYAAGARGEQVAAAVAYMLCALGTACIYYGTEQGFSGEGPGDEYIREPMFDLDDPRRDRLDAKGRIYQEISRVAAVQRKEPAMRFGRMYFREISGDGKGFGLPQGHPCTLAFSRILANEETLVAYNTSVSERRKDYVVVDSSIHPPGSRMRYLYGREGEVKVLENGCVRLDLDPMQFVILK